MVFVNRCKEGKCCPNASSAAFLERWVEETLKHIKGKNVKKR